MQNWKQKRSNMQHYDLQAEIYDLQYIGEQDKKIETMLESINFCSKDLVLDLGCGTGFLFKHIVKKSKLIVGVDLSKKALIQAKKRAKNSFNVELICADADNTPFVDNLFDKVFAVTVLQNMPDATKTIQEMKRIGKSEAMFAVTGLKKKFSAESFFELLKNAELKVVKFNDDEQLKGYVAVYVNS
ncbi:MAG: class I SAM-dependent methyltransferase [archaeon]